MRLSPSNLGSGVNAKRLVRSLIVMGRFGFGDNGIWSSGIFGVEGLICRHGMDVWSWRSKQLEDAGWCRDENSLMLNAG